MERRKGGQRGEALEEKGHGETGMRRRGVKEGDRPSGDTSARRRTLHEAIMYPQLRHTQARHKT